MPTDEDDHVKADMSSKSEENIDPSTFPPPKFFMNCCNGSHIVLPHLKRLGWSRVTDIKDLENCFLKWTETVMQQNYQDFEEGKCMVNHIPNCGLFCNKLGLLMSLRSFSEKVGFTDNQETPLNFIPETYWLGNSNERTKFLDQLSGGGVWIMKPCGSNQGRGICLIHSKREFHRIERAYGEAIQQNRIVQRYITSPLLLNKRKFDIRCFLMIASTLPYLVLFAPGYARLSLHKYDVDDTSLITHLTNQCIQRKDPKYANSKEDSVWTFSTLNEYINQNVAPEKKLPYNWVMRNLLPEMRKISRRVFNAVREKLACRMGFFEIYGMDFMIDVNMKVWLIEINTNPAMTTNCEVLKHVIPPIVKRFINISVECFEKARRWQPLLPIHGIFPRNPSKYHDITWNIGLKYRQEYFNNNGLPSSFSVLYNERLSSAMSRQPGCYKIPLDPWLPPKPTSMSTSSGSSPPSSKIFTRSVPDQLHKQENLKKAKTSRSSASSFKGVSIRSFGLSQPFKKDRLAFSPKLKNLPSRKSQTTGAYCVGDDNVPMQSETSKKMLCNFENYDKLKQLPKISIEPNDMLQLIQGVEFTSKERNIN
nr:protein polyglycylase TTLL10 [Hymenolepis microstoma]